MFKTDVNVPKDEITSRIRKFQTALCQRRIDAALILQNTDLYYFSGTIQQSHLYIPAEGDPLLMVTKSLERARAESPLTPIVPLSSPKKMAACLKEHGRTPTGVLGMELDVLPVNHFNRYRSYFPDAAIVDVSQDIRILRSVKSSYEIEAISLAARRSDAVAAHAATLIRPGMTELELAGLVEAHARKLGHQGTVRMRMWGGEMFYGHLMAGPSGAVPSYLASPTGGVAPTPAVAQGAGFSIIRPGEPILLDYVFALNGYISDHTRIFALESLPDDLLRAQESMLGLQRQLKHAARPGVKAGTVYDMGVSLAAQAGYADHFMGADRQRIRFIGHGVGLELDELPIIAKGQEMVLEEGMVIALEPKLIFPGLGVVGIENTHVVTRDGLQQLGRYPDDVTIVSGHKKREPA
jgi:Xaa-Pro aminopeptidase